MLGANTISSDLPCHACGYNLRGLPHTGKCPECSKDIALSLPRAPVLTPLEARAIAKALARVFFSALAILVGILAAVLIAGLFPFASRSVLLWCCILPLAAGGVVHAIGVNELASRCRALAADDAMYKDFVFIPRAASCVFAVAAIFTAAGIAAQTLTLTGTPTSDPLVALTLLCAFFGVLAWFLTFLGTMDLAEVVSQRLSRPQLARTVTKLNAVCLLVGIFGGCVIPPVALILYSLHLMTLILVARACRQHVLLALPSVE